MSSLKPITWYPALAKHFDDLVTILARIEGWYLSSGHWAPLGGVAVGLVRALGCCRSSPCSSLFTGGCRPLDSRYRPTGWSCWRPLPWSRLGPTFRRYLPSTKPSTCFTSDFQSIKSFSSNFVALILESNFIASNVTLPSFLSTFFASIELTELYSISSKFPSSKAVCLLPGLPVPVDFDFGAE